MQYKEEGKCPEITQNCITVKVRLAKLFIDILK